MLSTAICVFAYKRPIHLAKVLDALASNEEAKSITVYVYIDGPKEGDNIAVASSVREVASAQRGFSDLRIIARQKNLGLYKSVTDGVTSILQEWDSVIVLEDDIVLSTYCIEYFLESLKRYQDNPRVASIHGYCPPFMDEPPETFFLRGADCWGWATWRDKWSLFRSDAARMAHEIEIKNLRHEFNLKGGYDYLGMLKQKALGKNNSWAICWHASCFIADKLTLYPGRSLVSNIGFDNSGEHCKELKFLQVQLIDKKLKHTHSKVMVDSKIFEAYCQYFRQSGPRKRFYRYIISLSDRILFRIKYLSAKIFDD